VVEGRFSMKTVLDHYEEPFREILAGDSAKHRGVSTSALEALL
jgi:hypothetical protein